MVEVRDGFGKVVSRSRNLRGILRLFGKQLINVISIDKIGNGEGKLCVLFDNGDSCETNFADFSVLEDWVKARRTLRGVKLMNCGKEETIGR